MGTVVRQFRPDGTLVHKFERWDPALAGASLPFSVVAYPGRRIDVHCWGDATLADLRRQLELASGVPPELQILIAGGRRLHNPNALLVRDYGLMPGEKIIALYRWV